MKRNSAVLFMAALMLAASAALSAKAVFAQTITDKLISSTGALMTSIDGMADAFAEQNKNGKLTYDLILKTIDAGFAEALVIDNVTGAVRLDKEAFITLAQAKIWEQQASLAAEKAILEAQLMAESGAAIDAANSYIDPPETPVLPTYISFAGTVKEVRETDGQQIVLTENEDGNQVAFRVDGQTVKLTDAKAEKGAKVIGFYNTNVPMTMIYPPQPYAEVIAVNLPDAQSVKVDIFDENLISKDGELKLNISPDTIVLAADGEKYSGELPGRRLAVAYSKVTRSIPGITTPEKVVVLNEKAVAPIYVLTDEEKEMISNSFSNLGIIVNGKLIEGIKPFPNDKGILMVPVRAVSEAMGLPVEWLAESSSIQVGKNVTFALNKDAYSINKMPPVKLGAAPILKDDKTYVPMEFFSTILKAGVTITDGNLVIKSVE